MSGIPRRLFGLDRHIVSERLAQLDRLAREAEHRAALAEERSRAAVERVDDLAGEVERLRARESGLEDAFRHVTALESQARDEAERLLAEARESAAEVIRSGEQKAEQLAVRVSNMEAFHDELSTSIRSALTRFEDALAQLRQGQPYTPVSQVRSQHHSTLRAVPVEPDSESTAVDRVEAVTSEPSPDVTPGAGAPPRSISGDLHAVRVIASGVNGFAVLSGVEEALARHGQVADLHVESFDEGTAVINVWVPVGCDASTLVAESLELPVDARSPTEIDVNLGDGGGPAAAAFE